jgi:hypothetical protein
MVSRGYLLKWISSTLTGFKGQNGCVSLEPIEYSALRSGVEDILGGAVEMRKEDKPISFVCNTVFVLKVRGRYRR